MSGFGTIVGGGLTLIFYAVILALAYRIFQMASDVTEIKELLRDIKRNTAASADAPVQALGTGVRPDSAEALVRAVHRASYQEIDDAIADADKPVA